MTSFKDLGITAETKPFTGDKIKIAKVLNREIEVLAYRIEKSKYEDKGNGKCLHLQFRMNGEEHVLFTGSTVLMDMIAKVPPDKFPFQTTIVEISERYEFT